jgi:hypothetical protein
MRAQAFGMADLPDFEGAWWHACAIMFYFGASATQIPQSLGGF